MVHVMSEFGLKRYTLEFFTKNFRYLKWRNAEPSKAVFGGGLSLRPYPYGLGQDSFF